MDLDARIERRRRRDGDRSLIRNYESLSPAAHVKQPTGRGPTFERLLDHLDPVFDGSLPPNAYVHGPLGSGKSAVVTALFTHLRKLPTETRSVIYTSTRATSPTSPEFAYLDLRTTSSEFSFYRSVLNALVEEPIPEHGLSTDEIRRRLHAHLASSQTGIVIAIDHVDSPGGVDADELVDLFAGLPSNVSWLAIGRTEPEEAAVVEYTATAVRVDRYPHRALVDVLMARASTGLAPQALDHELARRIADWADGNAHDALAVLFVAADRADRAGRSRLTGDDVSAAIDEIPRPSVSLGQVLALPPNEQLVLRELIDLNASDRASVTETTEAISTRPTVDLSPGTVKRFLYEMAEVGIVERIRSDVGRGKGRPPSRIELRFPPTVFRRLYDVQR
jgi:Cdc6-like AAA superfamily ATPase